MTDSDVADVWRRLERMDKTEQGAAVLKTAFWEALKRCGDDDRVHDMEYPWHDAPRIDGRIPDVLWDHMEAAIQELRSAAGLSQGVMSKRRGPGDGTPEAETTDQNFWRRCCRTVRGSEHLVECEKWEPGLTVEELRYLRQHVLRGVADPTDAF